MAVKNIIKRGIGFTPGSVKFMPTRGFSISTVLAGRYVNRHTIHVDIFGVLDADAPLQALIGDPIRLHISVPKSVVFPWVRLNVTPDSPLVGVMHVAGVSLVQWMRRHTVTFSIHSLDRSFAQAAAIQTAIGDLMDQYPTKSTISGANITHAIPGEDGLFVDVDTDTVIATLEYRITVEGL